MGVVTQVTDAVRGRQTINPKTVLGFYATVLGILSVATVGVVGVLASNDVQTWLIPWLLGFSGGLLVLLVAGVFVVSLIDPSRLMLTQVTGTEYAHIQQTLILGDSSRGDRLEALPVVEAVGALVPAQPGQAVVVSTAEHASTGHSSEEPAPSDPSTHDQMEATR